jgi:hypothetical protein
MEPLSIWMCSILAHITVVRQAVEKKGPEIGGAALSRDLALHCTKALDGECKGALYERASRFARVPRRSIAKIGPGMPAGCPRQLNFRLYETALDRFP